MRELSWFLQHGMETHTQETLNNVLDPQFLARAVSDVSNNDEAGRLSKAITNLEGQRS